MPLLILSVVILLFSFGIYLLKKRDKFWRFFMLNITILVMYCVYFIYSDLAFLGSDEHSLGRMLLFIVVPITHVLITFVFAVFKSLQLKNENSKTKL